MQMSSLVLRKLLLERKTLKLVVLEPKPALILIAAEGTKKIIIKKFKTILWDPCGWTIGRDVSLCAMSDWGVKVRHLVCAKVYHV